MAVLPFGDVGRASGADRTIKLEEAVGDPDVTVVGVRPGGKEWCRMPKEAGWVLRFSWGQAPETRMQKRGMTLVFGDRQDPVFERLLRTSIKQLPSPDDHRGETKQSGNLKFNPAEQNVVGTGLSMAWVLEVRRFANPAACKYQGPFFSLATLKISGKGI